VKDVIRERHQYIKRWIDNNLFNRS